MKRGDLASKPYAKHHDLLSPVDAAGPSLCAAERYDPERAASEPLKVARDDVEGTADIFRFSAGSKGSAVALRKVRYGCLDRQCRQCRQ